jgi:hypothetical protein
MLASNVAQLVRAQVVQHLEHARLALPDVRAGVEAMAAGSTRGYVDASLATSRLGRALREAAIAETMLLSVGGRHGQPRLGTAVLDAIDAAALATRRAPDGPPHSIESLVGRARSQMQRDPDAFGATRSSIDARLDDVSRRLDDADEAVAARTASRDDAHHGWISEDGELHEFA